MSVRLIAQMTGVSPSTVSLALRNDPKIPLRTRQQVLKAAKQINYEPNRKVGELMRHLRSSRNQKNKSAFCVFSFYESMKPWENSTHLLRLYEGMSQRARTYGYKLEPMWLNAPEMTPARFRLALDTRGIQGLLCLGSPKIDEKFPPELNRYAIVAQGMSIKAPLHRVIAHAYNDVWRSLDKVYGLGYRRPGLVLGQPEEARSGYACAGAYFGWCEMMLGVPAPIPVLRMTGIEEKPLVSWVNQHAPDVIVLVHFSDFLSAFRSALKNNGIRYPDAVGVAVVSHILDGTGFSGMQENQGLRGARAVDLLVSQIANREMGMPINPRIEMVESEWFDGESLRAPVE